VVAPCPRPTSIRPACARYGWRPDPADAGRLVENAEEQAAIARIREERRQGKGLRAIARALEESGITCPGRRWSHSTIRSILRRSAQLTEAS
jgi:hypothetical protein